MGAGRWGPGRAWTSGADSVLRGFLAAPSDGGGDRAMAKCGMACLVVMVVLLRLVDGLQSSSSQGLHVTRKWLFFAAGVELLVDLHAVNGSL